MDVGGQAADQMAKTGIELSEATIKMLAAGGKNLTVFLVALAKDNKKVKGKTNLKRLLQENVPLKVFQIKESDWEQFKALAKRYGILFSGVKDMKSDSGIMDLLTNENYVSQVNRVMETLGYAAPAKEDDAPKKAGPRAPQEKCSPERGSGSTASTRNTTSEKPSVRGRLAALQAASKGLDRSPQREHDKIR